MNRKPGLPIVAAALAAAALSLPGRAAAAATIEERLEALEAGYAQLKEENARLRDLLAAKTAPQAQAAGAPPADAPQPAATPRVVAKGNERKLEISGFIQGQYEAGDAGDARFAGINDRFFFRRARLMVAGDFAEHFDFRLEADFGANSLGASTGVRASANEIYVNWNRYPAANVRVGYLKPAFGGDQLWSDTTFDTIERPLASDRIADVFQTFLAGRAGA